METLATRHTAVKHSRAVSLSRLLPDSLQLVAAWLRLAKFTLSYKQTMASYVPRIGVFARCRATTGNTIHATVHRNGFCLPDSRSSC